MIALTIYMQYNPLQLYHFLLILNDENNNKVVYHLELHRKSAAMTLHVFKKYIRRALETIPLSGSLRSGLDDMERPHDTVEDKS